MPASSWIFARIGNGENLTSYLGSDTGSDARVFLDTELRRQRLKSPAGPRISATLTPVADSGSGVTLVFADSRATFGILTLFRRTESGPFTSSEIGILTFGLDAVTEQLSAIRLQPSANDTMAFLDRHHEGEPAEREGAFYVLDDDLRIKMSWRSAKSHLDETNLRSPTEERLPPLLERTVRELTAHWSGDTRRPGVASPVPFLVVRTRPMFGSEGSFIGVGIERYRETNSLTAAAARFQISPREVQVLALMLDGNRLVEIAQRLFITSSTVQDHIKSMLFKTDSRNRSELIARVLGWEHA